MVKTLFFTIIHSAVGKAGSITFLDFLNNHFGALYVQVGILLTCKTGIRQIFRSSAGPYCYIRLFFTDFFAQFLIGLGNGILQILGHFLIHDGLAQLSTDIPQLCCVFHVSYLRNQCGHFFFQAGLFNKIAIGICGSRISIRHRNIGFSRHLSQRR